MECNRYIKFSRLLRRADALGFGLVATGHHARIVNETGRPRLARGVDKAKDQSYVLHMLDAAVLERLLLPVGETTKDEVRREAEARGLVTAAKPDSQDVCFITASAGRRKFLSERIEMRPGRLVDTAGQKVGTVDALELVTVGQRRGLGAVGGGTPRYVLDVDAESSTVTVGSEPSSTARSRPWRTGAGRTAPPMAPCGCRPQPTARRRRHGRSDRCGRPLGRAPPESGSGTERGRLPGRHRGRRRNRRPPAGVAACPSRD